MSRKFDIELGIEMGRNGYRNGQKLIELCRNGQNCVEMGRNGQKQTEMGEMGRIVF